MSWTAAADIRARARAMWDRGELLAALVATETPFPLRIPLKRPKNGELDARFDEVRTWIRDLRALPHCRLEMREIVHRVLGANTVPQAVWIDSLDNAIRLAGKTRDAARFTALCAQTEGVPFLSPLLIKRPLRALDLAEDWPHILIFVDWLRRNPRPGVYLRQVDQPGLHTKFIEAHRGVLAELLDLALPAEAIDQNATGVAHFARRYGFLDKPVRVRLRLLDPALCPWPDGGTPDLTVDRDHLARMPLAPRTVFITENEINFLAFPPVPGSLIIFGGGYGFEMLDGLEWLERARVFYWGDIDTHGFAILDELRAHYPRARSFLMDRATLLGCEACWGREEKQTARDLPRLTPEEAALYNELRDNRLRANLRLEQERIGFDLVRDALNRLDA